MAIPVLPDFTRWQWAGTTERAWFKPKFEAASRAFLQVERWSVADGVRPAAWQFIPITEMVDVTNWGHKNGVLVLPTSAVTLSDGYATMSTPNGTPNALRCVLVRPDRFKDALPFQGDERIGELLGFPACCRQAFATTWGQNQVDSTFEQLATSNGQPFFWQNSSLLRWVGIRMVPHMPCHYGCEASRDLGQALYDVGCWHGYREEMDTIKDALNWPVRVSRLFGIMELTTPALKITTRSDWTPTEEVATRTDGAKYSAPKKEWWQDNGFTDPWAMKRVHELLSTTVADRINEHFALMNFIRVTDLGCGDGRLMRLIKSKSKHVLAGGIDTNAAAIGRVPMLSGKFHTGRIQDGAWATPPNLPQVALINPIRLIEMSDTERGYTLDRLADIPLIFVYTYSDIKEPLEDLAKRAGMRPVEMLAKTPELSVGVC